MGMESLENYKTQTVKRDYQIEIEAKYAIRPACREVWTITAESVSEALRKVARMYDDPLNEELATKLIARVRSADEPSKPLYQMVMDAPATIPNILQWFAVRAAFDGF